MASYMTTMFQIARSIFQSKPISVTEVKEVRDISKPEEAMKNTTDISAPVQIMSVNAVKDLSAHVEIISVPETLKDMAVKDTNDVKENLIPVEDVIVTAKEPNIVPENVETETEKPVKAVDSAPKRKPRGKTIKK